MTTSDFDNHKVDHLFLLIGENPLPNYVAARLLLENGGTVHLVYTTQTKKRADLLTAELDKFNIIVKPVELGDSSADGYKIIKKIKEKIKPLVGRIGLNYTGGTKAMAVHAYQAFVEKIDDLENPVFSYLDSVKLQMCIEDINNNKIIPIPSALAICPQPKLEQILGLHNLFWQENKLPICKSQFPEAATKFVKLYHDNNSDIIQGWKDWCKVLEKGKDHKNGGYKTDENLIAKLKIIEVISSNEAEKRKVPNEIKNRLKNIVKEYFPDEELNIFLSRDKKEVTIPTEIQSILKDDWPLDFTEEINLQLIKDKYQINISDIYEWLNNGWLEDYVMWQVEQISKNRNIHEIKRSIHIEDPDKKREKNQKDQFEFDVAFLRGYQLFGISCTIEHRHKDLKHKLFEAYLRARQLGGDEARVALVCRYDEDPDNLKQELSLILGNPKDSKKDDSKDCEKYDPKIEIFVRKDLDPKRFTEKLDKWIFRNI